MQARPLDWAERKRDHSTTVEGTRDRCFAEGTTTALKQQVRPPW
jgi:hypothetical protein